MAKKENTKTGRPLTEIDESQVEKLAMLHCTNVEIGAFFDVDESTIRKRFSDKIQKAKEKGKISLRRLQWKSAESGNVTMQIWLGKQYLGQSEKIEQGEGKGTPTPVKVEIKFEDASVNKTAE
jgi:hypothetical protein